MTFAASERAALGGLLLELGPDAPTLCAGWTTKDMAVHLLLRETRPDAVPGMFLPAFRAHLRSVSDEIGSRSHGEIVRRWMAGPPKFSPVRFLDAQLNAGEHFIHHEDVRRARPGWRPRRFSPEDENVLSGVLRRMGVRLLRNSELPVIVDPDGAPSFVGVDRRGVVRSGSDVIRVSGPVGEILLFCFGREEVDVTVSGDADRLRFARI
ncbi:TIGR03085 family metal-binding protein [Corynebacterium pygosceleis]|uniref:TIGR03085 family metal-binding protein n=1 Tax=Corynebacterium pygosceleis TaxID=2800406 RepID=A0ABT3WNV6_9CORY|nr:TIGR03085 family metal-binding protein [Corynebacterium pygosceleis]MCK7674309.1 TIGR03085 family metal-binding protein [Corynebacterium pygosceleis]MCL0120393.1 TIGR03085 family metal-binding protein [Corynebacterium pygosceleis]MCX7443939.1 TIGR03085 family metal-binding protein [Corynebacterium pygosceleis]